MLILTSPTVLLTHASALAQYRLADNFIQDVDQLTTEHCTAESLFISVIISSEDYDYLSKVIDA